MISRRKFLKSTATASLIGGLPWYGHSLGFNNAGNSLEERITDRLKHSLTSSVILREIQLYHFESLLLLKVLDDSGAEGITVCNARMQNLVSLFKNMVVPFFVGKDAREVAHLVNGVHRVKSNYKYAGMPFWNCVGSLEVAIWDLLGNLGEISVNQFLGHSLRTEVPIYLSSLTRSNSAEEETQNIIKYQESTGAKAVKLKVGGRLKNTTWDKERTRKFIPMVRKTMGDDFTIYADANGSYSVDEAKEVVRFLEDYGIEILEEPCYWQDYKSNTTVKKALTKMKLAGGEQDSSYHQFRAICEDNVYDILQPDVYYNGGIVRTLKIAHLASTLRKGFAPHSPKADPLFAPYSQLATVAPVLTGFQEYPLRGTEKQKSWFGPKIIPENGLLGLLNGNGLGIRYDDGLWAKSKKV
ncbi:mandelate racemase/muconate lactonizing enzyme family protein [Ulvibacterium sp.]|uniref:mandelate racemase/muconate lactonizing enzyme family protein n=1 Tax=Ulvibacterium sp. TaxID=2665914 RepID=UPI002601B226|nr:mandelate racemase/muconate lactonizing enzyme family protein [Ulvibacterium sp.]